VRTRILPSPLQRFGLTPSIAPVGGFSYIHPSVHERRSFAFLATFDKFFGAEDRVELLRERAPEFYDTFFIQDRRRLVLMTFPQLIQFRLDGLHLWPGAFVDVCLAGNVVVHQACITEACYSGSGYGVGTDKGVHAGDLVFKCNDTAGEAFGSLVCRHRRPVGLDASVWIDSSAEAPVRVKEIHPSAVVAVSTAAHQGNDTGRHVLALRSA